MPYGRRVMTNGHEWAKRQLAAANIGFSELDNGLWKVDDPLAAEKVCSRLGAGHLCALIDRWLPDRPARSRPPTIAPATGGRSRCARSRSPTPPCSTGPPPVERGSRRPSATTSISAAPTRCASCSTASSSCEARTQTPGAFSTQVITPGTRARIEIR